MIQYSPMRAGGEIGQNFLLAKISTYMYMVYLAVTVAIVCFIQLEQSRNRNSGRTASPTGASGMKQSKLEDLYRTAQDDIQVGGYQTGFVPSTSSPSQILVAHFV